MAERLCRQDTTTDCVVPETFTMARCETHDIRVSHTLMVTIHTMTFPEMTAPSPVVDYMLISCGKGVDWNRLFSTWHYIQVMNDECIPMILELWNKCLVT